MKTNKNPTIHISREMKNSYLDYAMSVIVSRALPDVRDGLKPVHRRILYAMMEGGYDWTKPPRKSARIVGDVMGNYHPHGDSSIYEAMVRMAQNFSMRLPLVDGQGNFGSIDGDPPAAMRYTESRLASVTETLLRDIDKETVDFTENYDETQLEPTVLPAEYPNLLVNGANGIAVGMATNIPPHNPDEVLAACEAYISNPRITTEELIKIVQGPDFPTGGLIMGSAGIKQAYELGRGSIIVRSKTEIVTNKNGKESIIITEMPYQVNKAQLLERLGQMVRDKTMLGITAIRDESDRNGMRVVIMINRDHAAETVLNNLYKHTRLQTSFAINMLAMNNGKPEQMSLRDVISAFCEFRKEVITKRSTYLLGKARERAHILAGLLVALTSIDEIINIIKSAKDAETARNNLSDRYWEAEEVSSFISLIDDPGNEVVDGKYKLSTQQIRSILDLRLQRLTGMERQKLIDEMNELANKIKEYLKILKSPVQIDKIVLKELSATRNLLNDPRRTEITNDIVDNDDDSVPFEETTLLVRDNRDINRMSVEQYNSKKHEYTYDNAYMLNTHSYIIILHIKR